MGVWIASHTVEIRRPRFRPRHHSDAAPWSIYCTGAPPGARTWRGTGPKKNDPPPCLAVRPGARIFCDREICSIPVYLPPRTGFKASNGYSSKSAHPAIQKQKRAKGQRTKKPFSPISPSRSPRSPPQAGSNGPSESNFTDLSLAAPSSDPCSTTARLRSRNMSMP